MDKLTELREKIDAIDEELVELLEKRAALALEVRDAKASDNIRVYSSAREHQILERVSELAKDGPFPKDSLTRIFANIVSATRSLVGGLSVAFVGEESSRVHQAALRHFGDQVTYCSSKSVPEVFGKLERGELDYGVVPVETRATGLLIETFDAFIQSRLQIIAEIEDGSRYFVVGQESSSKTGKDKTSLICCMEEEPGALMKVLRPFEEQGLTLTKIESKTSTSGPWQYLFYIDVSGHQEDASVSVSIEKLRSICKEVRVLGSYPMAIT